MNWHARPVEDILREFQVDEKKGLSSLGLPGLLQKYGRNELPDGEASSVIKVFFLQFKSPLIYLLLLASIAAFFLGEFSDGWVILFVVTLNALIGAFQEAKAEKSMRDLKKITKISVRVLRDGREKTIEAGELVPGDIVRFNAGDAVPADIRIIEAHSLEVSEAVLTGESVPVTKSNETVAEKSALGDRIGMLYSGTFITAGRATGVVISTGLATEIGQIAKLTSTVEEPPTPLTLRVAQFSRYLILGSGIMFCLIVGIGLYQGIPFSEIVMISISQVVSLVPEGLPVAMTIAAAVGVQRMAARKTIVRKLSAVETLGSTTIICSDKTGTLTLNKMSVIEVRLWPREVISWVKEVKASDDRICRLFQMAVLCNDARLLGEKELGDPTETALLRGAEKIGIHKEKFGEIYSRVNEIPFESVSKMMATEHNSPDGEGFVALKGAPDSIIELCDLSEEDKTGIREMNEQMARNALRVLAFAWVPGGKINGKIEVFKGRATFLGLLGQMDPPREEVRIAIEECRQAGIRPVMITGDHKSTGLAIAQMIGLAKEGDRAIDGLELETIGDIDDVVVFARVHPSQKLKLVESFQKKGHVVAMTGDGVNDAPALGKADVGVAMGITGTEVAKEASKIIVTDDNFATIVAAISEGRLVYQNIKKVVLLLFSTSLSELIVLLLALIFGFPAPFAAVQILWNNLVTEGVITVNLIMDPPEGTEMQRAPISRNEPLINRIMLQRMFFIVPTIVLCGFGWFVWRIQSGIDLAVARTETLTMLVVCEWLNVLNCRSEKKSALTWEILKNKWLIGGLVVGNLLHILLVFWHPFGKYFHTVPMDIEVIPRIVLIGSSVLWVEEIRKAIVRARERRANV